MNLPRRSLKQERKCVMIFANILMKSITQEALNEICDIDCPMSKL